MYRPSWVLSIVMAVAGLLWAAILLYLLTFDGVPAKTLLSAGFFVAFFAIALAYYARSAIFVDSRGLVCRGVLRTRRLTWSDIRKVDVLPGPITVYAIRAPGSQYHFTSFYRNHRRLANLLIERAGLAASR